MQVVEISGMTEHLLTECDVQERFAQCPKCKEAMLKVDLEEHFQGKCPGISWGVAEKQHNLVAPTQHTWTRSVVRL